jgi:hypothetical protein
MKITNVNDFDLWRKQYDDMTTEEHVEYHNLIEKHYPVQSHYTYNNIKDAIELSKPKIVLEFGPWKADMACRALAEYNNIEEWHGIEICKSAIDNTNCNNAKFKYIFPTEFDWFTKERIINADLIVATHFIEHLSNEHFEKLVTYCNGVKTIYFEAPMSDVSNNWTGYGGTHKLEYGWNKVIELFPNYTLVEKYLGQNQGILLSLK